MKRKKDLPKRIYYQVNGKSPMENYIEFKQDLMENYNKKKQEKLKQKQEQKKFEKFLEKSLDKEVHAQLDKFFSNLKK